MGAFLSYDVPAFYNAEEQIFIPPHTTVGFNPQITVDDSLCVSASGDKPCHLSLSWKEAPQKLFKDVRILIADGLLELQVLSIENETIICKAKNKIIGIYYYECAVTKDVYELVINENETLFHDLKRGVFFTLLQ